MVRLWKAPKEFWVLSSEYRMEVTTLVDTASVGIRKAALPVLVEARPYSVKATGQFLEGSGPESVWPSVGA